MSNPLSSIGSSTAGVNYGSLLGEFSDPKGTMNPVLYGVIIPVFLLTVPIFCARIYSRSYPIMLLWWDDFFIVLAFLLEVALFGIAMYVSAVTGGRHIVFIALPTIEESLHLGFFVFILAPIANALVKISLCLMLLRIKGHDFWWRCFLWGMICLVVVVVLASALTTIVSCHPISAFWSITGRFSGNDCWPLSVNVDLAYAFGAFYAFTDLIMALLPIAFLQNVQLPVRDKIILCALMASGLLAMGAGIARILLLREVYTGDDFIYGMALYGLTLHLEILIGIMAACVPPLRAPFERMLRKFGFLQPTRTKYHTNQYTSNSKEMSVMSIQGNRTVDARVSSSRQGIIPKRKDVILVDASVSWESSSMDEGKNGHRSYLEV